MSRLRASYPIPVILIIQAGGNDVGQMQTLLLLAGFKRLFLLLQTSFPQTVFFLLLLYFSEVIPRFRWRNPHESFFDRIRKRVNRSMMVFLRAVGGFSFRHELLEGFEPGLFWADGVHLSDIGLDIFNCNLEVMVKKAAAWSCGGGGHACLGRHDWWDFVTQGSGWTADVIALSVYAWFILDIC